MIELILGPMFGYKSSEMIRRLRRHQHAGKNVIAIKWNNEKRYSEKTICTHNKDEFTDVLVTHDLTALDVSPFDVIGIDEGQFFNDLDVACEQWAQQGKIVIVAMLDGTFARQPFPNGCLARLIPLCESIIKLNAVCKCGLDAAFTEKTTSVPVDSNGFLVGGKDDYTAACRACHKVPK